MMSAAISFRLSSQRLNQLMEQSLRAEEQVQAERDSLVKMIVGERPPNDVDSPATWHVRRRPHPIERKA
jgi:hypothetical protein